MKKYQDARLLLIGPLAFVLLNTACASITLQLPSDHPARIDAPSGRVEIDPAAILRPNAPLYPSEARALPRRREKTVTLHPRGRVKRRMSDKG